jgi:predicted signal transduction protein with EAL and GGDEF domain
VETLILRGVPADDVRQLMGAETSEELIARADAALYAVKRAGRNQTIVADAPRPEPGRSAAPVRVPLMALRCRRR